jgi:MFS family permease
LQPRTTVARPASLRDGLRNAHRVIRRDHAYRFFQLAFFLSGSAFFMSGHIVLKLVHDRLHFGPDELALWCSVVPQLLLAVCSLGWGRMLDRIGIVRARLLISVIMTVYLGCYLCGIVWLVPALIYVGSILRGLAEGGGQLTWSLASSHFAPRPEDVPLYNGIHFVLNGVRGLVMPTVGSLLFVVLDAWTIGAATVVSAVSIHVIVRSLRFGERRDAEPAAEATIVAGPVMVPVWTEERRLQGA